MKYFLNGKEVTVDEVINAVHRVIPNGGLRFVKNVIMASKEQGLDTATIRVGDAFKLTVNIKAP